MKKKRGRPPRKGIAGDNGKRLRKSRSGEQADKAREVVAIRRCRDAGLRATEANKRRVMASNFGSAVGILVEAGHIPQRLANAGLAFAELEIDYARMMGFPRRHAQSAAYGEVRGGTRIDAPEYVNGLISRYSACQEVVRKMGVVQRDMLFSVCVDDTPLPNSPRALECLRLALISLAAHFGEMEKSEAA